MPTSPDVVVCAFDFLEFVRGTGNAFQPASVSVQMDGLTGAIGVTSFLAVSDGADFEFANIAAPTSFIGTMTVD